MNREQKKKMEQQLAENRKIVQEWLARDSSHKKPVTRRDFLTAGVQCTMGAVAAPSIFAILDKFNQAHAADCAANGNRLVPWIQINARGGHGFSGNWAPFDEGGNKLASYTTLSQGENPDIITSVFGNGARWFDVPDNDPGGKILAGIRDTANAAVLQNTSFIGVPCRNTDDSSDNNWDASGLVTNAGLQGTALPLLDDVRHDSAFGMNPPAQLNVGRFEDLVGALGFAGVLGVMNPDQLAKTAELAMNLSTSQARRLASFSGGQNVMDLVECATGQNYDNLANQSIDAIDPRNDQAAQGIYDFNDRDELARGAMVYNALKGVAGVTSIEFGGRDYHNRDRIDVQDARDRELGQAIGRILSLSAALGEKVCIPVLSDGAVSCRGTAQGDMWRSDSGSRGSVGVFFYDPAGAPATADVQMGSFTSGQVANRDFVTGDSPDRAIAAIALNWAKFSGDMGKVLNILPNNTFSQADLDKIILL